MRFSEAWLREWVDPPVDSATLAEQLTMAGLEVDAVEPAAGAFDGVVVGEVKAVEPHPDADKLRVCAVDTGEGAPATIVCGAPNVRAGMKAPCARVGAALPGGLKIKRAKLRGVESSGMLCSARELGLSEEHAGLMDLPADAPVGADLREYLGLDDAIIEVDLTPNRGDCLGMAGVAREVGVLNRAPVTPPVIEPVAAAVEDVFPVTVADPAACPRYLGRVIRGVDTTAPTPLWMQERLRRGGIRSLGPVVDVTNYVLLELGQPMHAFDLGQLRDGIVVRMAHEGERLTLLDGQEISLDADTLVIADGRGPLALAGIMGGAHSGVTDGTRDLFLECAFFSPTAIAGRARRHGLQTDSSYRFERGVDPELQHRALERATALLLALVGGEPGPVIDVTSAGQLPRPAAVSLRAGRLARVLGTELPGETVEDILARLGADLVRADDGWRVTPPAFRFDLTLEADLIEEVARVHGYNRLPSTAPAGTFAMGPVPEATVADRRLAGLLADRGYQEAITYSFVDARWQSALDPERTPIPLANPLSAELGVMRTSLWSGLLQALAHNVNRQQERGRLFEIGLNFIPQDNETKQDKYIAGVAWGDRWPEQWGLPAAPVDFFDVKGDVEALLAAGGRPGAFRFEPASHPALHPGRSAAVYRGETRIGWLGELHPRVSKSLDLPDGVYVFEVELTPLAAGSVPAFEPVSRYPAIRRDLALVVDETVSAADVAGVPAAALGAPERDWLKDIFVFDEYRGKGVEEGRKSLALGLILQDSSRTLTEQDVEEVVQRVTERLRKELNAKLRD